MTDRGKGIGVGVVIGALGLMAMMAGLGLFVVYSGAYNVAATEEHTSVVRWAFHTTLHNSVEQRAAEVVAPEGMTPEMIAAGASEYKAMCQTCHAGPGVERTEWASGMRPQPPRLADAASHWKIEEVFWIARHGIKMTGMPAFGPTHDDQTLWSIAAFVNELPGMTPERYASFGDSGAAGGGHGGATHHGSGRGSTDNGGPARGGSEGSGSGTPSGHTH